MVGLDTPITGYCKFGGEIICGQRRSALRPATLSLVALSRRMPGARQARGRAPVKAKRAGRPVDERLGGRRGRPFACRQCGKRSAAFRWTKQFCSLRCRVAALKIVGIDDPAFMRRVMEHVVALQAERAKLTAGCP